MPTKTEGPALPPVPVAPRRAATLRRPTYLGDAQLLPCEMCGARVVSYHDQRICLRCGFMTGWSEGI
jgi:hypothetical protein